MYKKNKFQYRMRPVKRGIQINDQMRASQMSQQDGENVEDSYSGTCNVCGSEMSFKRTDKRTRETYICTNCKSLLRYRTQAAALLSVYGQGNIKSVSELAFSQNFCRLHIYEPGVAGPFRKLFGHLGNYKQSFWWEDVKGGESRDGLVCQDLQHLTYDDAAFDLVISSDIFEHIRKPYEAFSEIARVLKKGGYHIFTIPAEYNMYTYSVNRVDVSTDEDKFLLPPAYHGSGVAGGKSLVYTDFGKDLFVKLAELGTPTVPFFYQPPGAAFLPQLAFISVRF